MATGELADAIHRDLLTDQLTFDQLGWRGLWAYVTKAPRNTAIYDTKHEGLPLGERLLAEYAAAQLDESREINWRYTAVHFKNGVNIPFPQPVPRPWLDEEEVIVETWETVTIDQMVSPAVRDLLKGE